MMKMNMKHSFLLVFIFSFFVGHSPLIAQDNAPVSVELRLLNDSTLKGLVMEFTVDSNWIVYDSIAGDNGPIPLSFQMLNAKGVPVNFEIKKPKIKKKFDDLFMMDIYYFEDHASYQFIVPSAIKTGSILTMEVEYMCCNLSTGVCMPPTNQLLKIELQ